MSADGFHQAVFVNCPLDDDYKELLAAMLFCIVYLGFTPRLASERVEAGENRLDKIAEMIMTSKYSIHDLSRCKAEKAGDYFRMNMPFEFGLDFGFRRGGGKQLSGKKFLIFEEKPYELKKALSDIAGQDAEFHSGDYKTAMKKVRDFFRVEAKVKNAPGPSKLIGDYATFQGWMVNKKRYEGHSETDAFDLPTRERLDEMRIWIKQGRPSGFIPPRR